MRQVEIRSEVCGTRGFDGRSMATAEAAVASPEAGNRTARQGPSHGHQRDLVDFAYWRPMAGLARALRSLGHRGQPFLRWRKQGLWDRLLAEVRREADAMGQLEWEVHYVDGANVRAHQHAAGAKRGRAIRRWAVPGEGSEPKST